jgi:hypothetical protein
MMLRFAKDRPIAAYCDLHGHSKKQNVFIYGCQKEGPKQTFLERVLPRIISLNAPDMFNWKRYEVIIYVYIHTISYRERFWRKAD